MAAQRYETIAKETDIYYSSKCPVVLCAYAVLLDSKMKKYVAQLKLRNCGSEVISSVSVVVRAYDHFDEVAEEINGYQYVGVNVKQGEEFGTKSLIPLSKKVKIKRLEVAVNKIVFSNGSTWDSENGELLDNRLEPQDLASIYSDKDIENYRFMLNSKMKYVPYQKGMLWICSCGEMNYGGESCYSCGVDKAKAFDYMNKEHLNSALLDPKYNNGIEMKKQRSIESLKAAITIFEELGDYKDSKEQISVCKQEIDSIQKEIEAKKREEERLAEIQRKEAEEKSKRNTKTAMIVAAIIAICLAGFFVATNVIIPNAKYNAAVKLMENEDYDAAIEAFKDMGDYKDAPDKILECRYRAAVELMDNEEYTAARSKFVGLGDYKDSKDKVSQCEELDKEKKYLYAVALMESGKYVEAYKEFKQVLSYKDSKELAESIEHEYEKSEINAKNIGDVINFGKYDFFLEIKGIDSIKWIILAKENNKALLISEYILDCIPFGSHTDDYDETNWESCTLRKWLNTDFYNEAFSEGEKNAIEETTLSTIAYDYDSGEQVTDLETKDKVFILSADEAEKYFESTYDRRSKASELAQSKDIVMNEYSIGCWWLRSPQRSKSFFPEFVDSKGEIPFYGLSIGASVLANYGVRPAIWVDLGNN